VRLFVLKFYVLLEGREILARGERLTKKSIAEELVWFYFVKGSFEERFFT
jgi:hypothetical protein